MNECPEINRLSISKTFPYENYKEQEITFLVNILQPVSATFEQFLLVLHLRESQHRQFIQVISSSNLVFMHKMSCENISRLFVIYTKKKVLVRKGLTLSNFRVPIRTNSSTSRILINHLHVKSLKPILKNVCGNPKNSFREESVQIQRSYNHFKNNEIKYLGNRYNVRFNPNKRFQANSRQITILILTSYDPLRNSQHYFFRIVCPCVSIQ